jgi:hypothetical protein
MKIIQNNKLRAYSTVDAVLDSHEPKWASLPAFVAGVARFRGHIAEIQELEQTQASRSGAASEKSYALESVGSAAFEVCAAVHAFAVVQQDYALEGRVDFSRSSVTLGRASSVVARCRDIHAAATVHVADLGDYGITAAKLTALKKKIDAFEESLAKPRQQVATSSAATVSLAEQFTEADTVLNKCLDKLVYQFKDSAPDFFNEFQTARSVVNIRGGRKTNEAPAPTPVPTPA